MVSTHDLCFCPHQKVSEIPARVGDVAPEGSWNTYKCYKEE